MIYVKYTEAEQQETNRLYEQHRVTLEEDNETRRMLYAEYPPPDTDEYYSVTDYEENPEAYEKGRDAWAAAMEAWTNNQPPAMKQALEGLQERFNSRYMAISQQLGRIRTEAIERHFKALEGDPAATLTDAKNQVIKRVTGLIDEYEATEQREGIIGFNGEALVNLGNGLWKLSADELKELIQDDLKRHYEMLEGSTDLTGRLTDQLNDFIETYLHKSPHVTTEKGAEGFVAVSREVIRTTYPLTLAAPSDKVSKRLFEGALTDALQPLSMESKKGKTKKPPIDTLASINFNAPQLQNIKGMTWYDSSVYSAVCAQYIRGKNEYITPQMIYQAMTGDENARLTKTQAQAISNSMTKFMYGGIYIDATEEINKRNISGSATYDTNLLHAERVRRNLNGTITEAYHIIKTPVLYEYANSKGQIANPPTKALAAPLNNNADNIALKAYLFSRVWAIKGGYQENRIAYKSMYEAVWAGEASSKTRMQTSRLRAAASKILEHWTKPASGNLRIKAFKEYKRGNTSAGVQIDI